ncbi:MAG: endonuclease III [Clostridia bacterium]|nr:endonuclease III [Clostridia bacterium]MBQ4637371.1 endonuclease III [Clostridia bacterium]
MHTVCIKPIFLSTKKERKGSQKVDHGALLQKLNEMYPNAGPELHFSNPYETLVATMLAAQCTDRQVNKVTPALFAKYPDIPSMAKADAADVYEMVKSCGFKSKAGNIVASCKRMMEVYGGSVPNNIEDMQTLPGVGRKTANVVYSNAFGGDAIAVDTHVFRVSNRLGLANAPDVLKTEYQLMENIPKADWSKAHHWLILHGRYVCSAKKPKCESCGVNMYCKTYLSQNGQATDMKDMKQEK